ncbi:MAG: UDP-3-O-(3-hydroxymyristoyl)glucosamine N-acyltransferase [Verrucomicrobiae bacterium]|nr:UDP-3-O-(3-hydroxymyristoyl)glucosamine N-acyltransferase [Verrucomicrobiae bacterium]MCX7722161.1 UDP-3-O-(3-hydroxymyristoyl)glucosamine N-acyltransferase [Verrucomicrobiae bacterium]MDW7980799.1 UDP-3-O-(3-hydroxymyristoyl)glucosamine N-acyltransferase [Verrucomicrobiales bacterium]
MQYTAGEIAKLLNAQLEGDSSVVLKGVAPADSAGQGDLTFAENESYFRRAEASAASAILVDGNYTSASKTLLRVPSARVAFAKALQLFYPEKNFAPGVHPTAIIAPTAKVAPSAYIGPYCVIGANVRIGERSVLEGADWIGDDSQLGDEVMLFPNVTVYPGTRIGNRVRVHAGTVIGSDGFGYVLDGGKHLKIPQVGYVEIGDDVEIGANVTIDRGTLGPTKIGRGTKIDNLVQIAHNVSIGENCIVVAQVGIAGSTQIGNYTTLAGQAGLAGHLKIGNNVVVEARSGVMRDIPDGQRVLGAPAVRDTDAKRQLVALQHLPELLKRVSAIEKKLGLRPGADQPDT